jgi:two-component system cell cycle response regulator
MQRDAAPRRGVAAASSPVRPRSVVALARPASRRDAVWLTGLTAYLLFYVSWLAWTWIPVGDKIIGQVILQPLNVAAAITAWQASRRMASSRRLALMWRLTALALLGQVAGGVAVSVYTRLGGQPYPSLADLLYLSFYPLMLGGLLLVPRRRPARSQNLRLALDLATTALGAATVIWYLMIAPTARAGGESTLQMAFSLAYPVGDVILIVGVASLLLRGVPHSIRRALMVIAAALGLFVIGDVLYAYVTLHGTFTNHSPLNLAYELALALFVVAARSQGRLTAAATEPGRPPRVSWAPYASVAAGFAVLLDSVLSHTPGIPVIAAAAAALAVLVSARQLLAQHELVAARGELEVMARADALTGLGNRRTLLADLARAFQRSDGATPGLLMLLDLNGFKNFNDAFGHPAGDALLIRLGGALSEAIAPFGAVAYRPGGDEFCVIARDLEDRRALEQAATLALTEVGPGFVVAPALGSVVIPGECADAAGAMRTADNAMYAQKATGRTSAGRQSTDVLLRALNELHPELDDHLGSVTDLVSEVGIRLEMSGEELARLTAAGALHDIGKIAIPASVISKPGALNQEEWALLRRHTLIGERIVEAAPALRGAAPLVRASHEAFDGHGYPDGLAGAAIPLGARVIAVCDAFDAMISRRSYSPPATVAEAMAELRRCAGTQFDPAIVDAFEQVMAQRAPLANGARVKPGHAPLRAAS